MEALLNGASLFANAALMDSICKRIREGILAHGRVVPWRVERSEVLLWEVFTRFHFDAPRLEVGSRLRRRCHSAYERKGSNRRPMRVAGTAFHF